MKTTTGVVSNIAYCDIDYCEARLRSAVSTGAIRFFAIIEHPSFDKVDSNGELHTRKKHLHILLEAGIKPIDLESMTKFLEQVDINSDKPLSVERWTRSNILEWLPYAVHDKEYCDFKRLIKPYYDLPLTDIRTSDFEYVQKIFDELPRDKWQSDIKKIMSAIEQGMNWLEFCDLYRVPLNNINSVQRAFSRVLGEFAYYDRYDAIQHQKMSNQLEQEAKTKAQTEVLSMIARVGPQARIVNFKEIKENEELPFNDK